MATAPPALSFSRPAFAKLSPHPFLLTSLSQTDSTTPASRSNGRAPSQDRPFQIHTGSLSHAHGSALVRLGDTTVVCGVRGEILPVTSIPQYRPATLYDLEQLETGGSVGLGRGELKDYDLLVPNIELATGCAPTYLPGVPPSTLAQKLSTRVYSLLHSCNVVDPKDLRIWYTPPPPIDDDEDKMDEDLDEDDEADKAVKPELNAYWVLYIDLLFVSLDGNPFDAAWTAVVAALKDTKLPVVRWDPDREMAVAVSRTNTSTLNIKGLPVSCTAVVFLEKEQAEGGEAHKNKYWMLLDPDRLEEELCQETVTVVVDRSEGETTIRNIEKQGGTIIGRELIRGFVGVAEKRWEGVKTAMP